MQPLRRPSLPVRIRLAALAILTLTACDPDATDDVDATDPEPEPTPAECAGYVPDPCAAGEGRLFEDLGGAHVAAPDPITWPDTPPASGPHRPQWARWGEYHTLGPEHWLHNLEHGGVALLYHPCAGDDVVDALRDFARSRPADAGGPFRWVLAPYPDLPAPVAAITWQWRYLAPCVNLDELTEFVDRHYRDAPEDIASDGSHTEGWLGR